MDYKIENPTDPKLAIRDLLSDVKNTARTEDIQFIDYALMLVKQEILTVEHAKIVSAVAVHLLQRTEVSDVEIIAKMVQLLRYTLQLERIELSTSDPEA